MSDNDMIRRGDALAIAQSCPDSHWGPWIAERLAALPAVTVRVKWRNIETAPRGGEWFIARTEHGTTRVVRYADEYDRFPISHDGVVWPTAPTEWTPLKPVLAALEPVAAPDPALRPTMTDMMVDPNTLDAFMEANPLPPDPAAIREAWEKAYWRMRSYAVHDDACKLNKPPHFDGPCSCGLTDALQDALALIQKGDTNV